MRHILFLLFMAFTLQAIAQYPATGNKMRLGWQTTGDGLVYRGAIGDTATLDPSGLNNAWMLLDTANGNLYAYRAKAWRLVSGGGGSVSDTLTGEVKGPLDSTYVDTVANIIFKLDSTAVGVGELKYNDTQGSIQQGLKGGNVTNVIGQQLHQRVLNKTGSPLAKGEAVYLQGSQGNRITVAKAIATIDSTSANTFGIVAESIANNQSGYIITEGLITGLNTSALTEGMAVYLSPTVAGGLTTTKPQAPDHGVYIGVCVKQNNGSGELFVKIRNGQELEELHDVRITSPVSNASLYYNAAQGIWRDTGAAVLVADTAAMLTNYINVADTATMLSSYISNADTSVFARDFQISGTTNYLAKFTGANTVGNSWFSQSDSVMTLNDTKKMQLYGRNGRRNYLEIFRGGTNIMQTNYVLATDTAYTASTGTTSRVYTHAVDNKNADYMISTRNEGGTGGYILLDAARTAVGLNNPVNRLDVEGAAAIGATYAGGYTAPTNGLLVEGNVGIATASPSRPLHVNATSAIRIPVGNFAERGTSGAGDIRVRSDTANLEFHNGTSWQTVINNSDTSVFARDVQISGTANRLAMFTGSNTVGNGPISKQADTINFVDSDGFVTFRFRNKYGTDDGSGASGRFPGFPAGTRFTGMLNSTSFASFSFGDPSGIAGYNATMQLTAWAGGGNNYYSTRFRTASNGDFGLFLSPVATDANPTYSSTPHLMILNGGNVGIATSSPSRPLHVNANSSMIIPSGETGTRPAPGAEGDIRFNSTVGIKNLEWYNGTAWRQPVNAARSPAVGLANSFSKFDANGLLDTSAVLVQSNGRIGIGVTPTEALQVNGTARATRFILNTFGSQTLSINNYAPSGTLGSNLWIGSGGQSSSGTSGASGSLNAGIGDGALFFNTTGFYNLAFGVNALLRNTTGNLNVSIGGASSSNNLDGSGNTAIGGNSLSSNTSGSFNIAIGYTAMEKKVTGSDNVAIGREAGNLTAASTDNTASDNSIYIGSSTKTASSGRTGEIVIGHAAVGNGSNTTTIGNTSTTATYLPAGSLYINGTVSPARTLHVNGEARISDLATDTPTRIVGADADGDLGAITLGTGLSISSGTLNASGISSVYIPLNIFAAGDTVKNTTTAKEFFLVHSGLNGYCIDSYTVKAIAGTGSADIQIDKNGTGGNLQSISGTTVYTKDTNIALATGDYIRGQVYNLSGTLVGLGLTLEIKATCN